MARGNTKRAASLFTQATLEATGQARSEFYPKAMNVEKAEESVEAPAVGKRVQSRYGPMVEASLTLTSGPLTFERGTDYIELVEGGFENVAIPPATVLAMSYFYMVEAPQANVPVTREVDGETVEVGGAAPVSEDQGGKVRYATLLKLGMGG